MSLPPIPEGWEAVICDWPSDKMKGDVVILSPDGERYRPLMTRSWGAEAPVTDAMRIRHDD